MRNEKNEFMELIQQVELLDENSQGQLVGGYTSISTKATLELLEVRDVNIGRCGGGSGANNCAGGNCVAGCGGG